MRSHAQSVRIIVWVQSCVTDFIYRENCNNNETKRGVLDINMVYMSVMVFLCALKRLFVCARLYEMSAFTVGLW